MASTGQTAQSDILSLMARFGNEIVQEQICNDVPILKSSALPRKQVKGKKAVFNVIGGGLDSSGWVKDHQALPTGSGYVPVQGEQASAAFMSRLQLGHQALWSLDGEDDSADLADSSLKGSAQDVSRKIGRGLFSSTLNPDGYAAGTTSGPSAGVYTDVGFTDVSGFREGDAVILYDTSASQTFCLEVIKVTPNAISSASANVGGLVSFANTVQGISSGSTHENGDLPVIASNDVFYQRGKYDVTGNSGTATDQSAVCVSFSDIASATGTLHNINPATSTGYGWTGITASSFGVVSEEGLAAIAMRALSQSGERPTHVIMNPAAAPAYIASSQGSVSAFGISNVGAGRLRSISFDSDVIGDVLGDYESGLKFMAKPVVLEPNCPTNQAVMLNKDFVELGVWKEPGPLDQAGDKLLLSQSHFAVDCQIVGGINLLCRKRRSLVVVSGITNL